MAITTHAHSESRNERHRVITMKSGGSGQRRQQPALPFVLNQSAMAII
ncbi:hypothetical protein GGE45_004015 [Rhizobium aethiopicum]|uniref:Uncharacterized protein n=1 Tax=Rhizobium aethiopicum TaxID=1138170 RepID=A0A7W6MJJ7_9HYPH|nr:hypothetical protein [Rhizobium aethiopicum]MBB4192871.1 hypothetical protein [Rhizobium aethiopicum]MBB4581664.1 hypothetical protein [Rhizobium aethiopicum]